MLSRKMQAGWLAWVALVLACAADEDPGSSAAWPHYGGDLGGQRYSPLDGIDRDNVDRLEVAWEHHSGDFSDGSDGSARTSMAVTPLVVDDTLYYCTPFHRVFALDPETGEERWVFDPKTRVKQLSGPYPRICRGVSYWRDARLEADQPCAARIYVGTVDSELIAIDARTGRACPDFGEAGRVALREGIADAPDWEYYPTSPPVVVRDVVVIGALVADNLRTDAPAGVVRAFDARSGALRWAWDPVPPGWSEQARDAEGQPLYQAGTPNVWAPMSADAQRGIVYVPTGNASPDGFSAARRGLDHFSSSVVALDSETGRRIWHYQTVHNDVWDYDVPAQPTLFQIPGVGGGLPALAQPTKMGHIFLLQRSTGAPLYAIEERRVPRSDVPDETLSPTQPFPTHPAPLHAHPDREGGDRLTPEDAWGFTPWDRGRCADEIAKYRSEGVFTPPSIRGSILYPNNAGGMNWGGVAIDPERGLLFANQMHVAAVHWLVPRDEYAKLDLDAVRYPDELYPQEGAPYAYKRRMLLSPLGAPCNRPPWGTLTAVDLRSGETRWRVPLGTTRDRAPFPLWFKLGAPNLGGSVVTASGLLFIGATTDRYFRAFDTESGELLWRTRIPGTANANPITYRLGDGRQFVVVAAGGHGWSEAGDTLLAFAVP
jgi:quinoprotein glucose dehydrogenase